MTQKGRIRVALVGAGGWGYQHARVFAARDDVELCAVAGRTEARTKARAEQFGLRAYLDIDDMLAAEKPDLVSLSLPNRGHYEPTLQVIRAGYPLLVEKPLVFDLSEAQTLLSEAEKRDLFFAINFNHRYAKPVQLAKAAIDAGQLGELVFATWRFGGEGGWGGHPQANLIETQCHGFDMLEHLCGPIASLAAEMTDMTGVGFSTMALSLKFANGAVGSLVGSYDSSYAYPETHRLEINGTDGRILIDDTVKRYRFHRAGEETGEVWEAGYFNDLDREFHRTFDRYLEKMLDAFKRDAEPPVHARAGYRALALAWAAIESHESGRRVSGIVCV
ncbi:MAG: Gfo/Idh/MocA family oxidoreductase [Chloroflexota bacterium]|nr:Gfo/Idh/MocA family oxidoreductase [Chloroflexota bacterium]MDE2948035.1 Gfo/Idh/MocA family oxidoreductase [Chloroflexota bacterium]